MKALAYTVFFLLWFVTSLWSNTCGLQAQPPKVGLVLSGGGARGFAHIGILKMLDSLEIPVDYVAGTSMGGIIGALYATGYSGRDIETLVSGIDWNEVFTDNPTRNQLPFIQKKWTGKYQMEFGLQGIRPLPPSGLIYGQNILLTFSGLTFPYESITDFTQLPIPFHCVAVNIVTGEEVVLKRGSLAKAMRATMSIPSAFSPVQWGDSLLVDGGMVNNLPVDVVNEMGADIVIAVDVGRSPSTREQLNSAVAILNQSITMAGIHRWRENVQSADVYIRPDLGDYSLTDFSDDKIPGILKSGDNAARKNKDRLDSLKRRLFPQPNPNIRTGRYYPNPLIPREEQTIYGISIYGNEHLPFLYIYQFLGIRPTEVLDVDQLNRRIMDMYGLGYFENIHYEVEPRGDNRVQLNIHVKESQQQKIRFGLRYDDKYKLVALIALEGTNMIIPGLRYEHELQFAGLTHYRFKAYYPSRTLNMPVYPYFRFASKNVPIDIFDLYVGNKIARYKARSVSYAAGLGLLIGKSFNAEIEYGLEDMGVTPDVAFNDPVKFPTWNDNLRKISASLIFDRLDNLNIPSHGVYLTSSYEGSYATLRSEWPYEVSKVSADVYHTFWNRHTIRLYGFHGTGHTLPIYKTPNQGHPATFVGMEYDQLFGNTLSVLRADYRYRVNSSLYLKLIYNRAFDITQKTEFYDITPGSVSGYGIGLKWLLPIGPVEFIVSWGDKNFSGNNKKQFVTYFLLGASIDRFLYQ